MRQFLMLPRTYPLPLCKGEGTDWWQSQKSSCTFRQPEIKS
ncbi:hypothetical protein [Alysiella crassa]|nr:hypothetical protein [Alysiella crassa]